MKTFFFALTAFIVITSCSGGVKNKIEGTDAQAVAGGQGETLNIDTGASSIHWRGSKPAGAGSHEGTINIKEGTLAVNGTDLVSGSFVIDMSSIVDKDLTDAKMNEMLINHLKSPDFFDVEKFPEAYFVITNVKEIQGNDSITHNISGNLKMKDVEKNITIEAKITKEGDTYKAVAVPFAIDRTQWNVQYGSKTVFANIKDQIINDDIEFPQIIIVAKAK